MEKVIGLGSLVHVLLCIFPSQTVIYPEEVDGTRGGFRGGDQDPPERVLKDIGNKEAGHLLTIFMPLT